MYNFVGFVHIYFKCIYNALCWTNAYACFCTFQLLGTPTESDLGFVRNEDARRYIMQLPQHPRQPLEKVFPRIHPLAIDLIDRMLTFDPTKRITGNFLI